MFESYGRYWVEMLRLPADVRAGAIQSLGRIDGFEQITDGLARGEGCHPRLAAPRRLGVGGRLDGRARATTSSPWSSASSRPSCSTGSRSSGPRSGWRSWRSVPTCRRTVLRALRDNRVVCLLCDRDIEGDGVEVEFFGERTTLPGGPATLALRTGATLLPVAVYFRPGRDHLGVVRPPVPVEREGRLRDDIARITQVLARELEALIRAAPEQWHLLQPNWPSDPRRADR